MQAFHIERDGRRLAAILHEPPAAGAPSPTALLICNPFGQEAVRVHRMQRVLCDQLQRLGLPSLRFDYHGAGESSGTDEEADLHGWVDDVLAADQALRERTGAARVLWLGCRLGGSLALLAAAAAPSRPAGLLLWEPIIDGAEYLARLRRDHERALQSSFGPFLNLVRSRSRAQLIGFGAGPAMLAQLQDMTAPLAPVGVPTTVIAPIAEGGAEAFEPRLESWFEQTTARALAASASLPRRLAFRHEFDWTAEDALNTALVPAPAVRMLRTEVEAMR